MKKLDIILETWKIVIRKGKKLRKKVCPPGFKPLDGRCVKMDFKEILNRRKATKKSAKKKIAKQAKTNRKRAKSLKKRRLFGLEGIEEMNILNKIDFILGNFDKIYEAKGDGDEYEKFFKKMLKKYGVTEPDQLSTKDKKKFFKEIEKKWKKEDPKTNDKDE